MAQVSGAWWRLCLALCLGAGIVACGRGDTPEAAADPTIAVTTALAGRETLRETIAVAGAGVIARSADWTISAPEDATIAELPKAVGDSVAVGEILVRFEVPTTTADLQARQAALVDANAQVARAQAEVDRYRPLLERGIIARNDFESRQSTLIAAQAAVAQAKTQLAVGQLQQERLVVRSRFVGVVAERLHEVGDFVTPAATDVILRVIDPAQLQIAIQVSLTDFDRLRPGQAATVTVLDSGAVETAAVTFAPRPADPAATTAEVRLTPQPQSALTRDAAVRVEILVDERVDVIVVPEASVRRDASASYVMTAGLDGLAHRRDVRVGLVTQGLAQIVSGISVGEHVITTALDLIVDGAPVRVSR